MLYWFGLSLLWMPIAITGWILTLLARKNLVRRFPIFSAYISYMVVTGLLKAIFLSNWHIYFYVYWFSEPGEIVFSILAIHESLRHVFKEFYRVRWFPFLFPTTVGTALIYSIWKAHVHPPLHVGLPGAIIIAAAIAAQYVILGISILFFVMVRFIHVRWRLYEFRIVLGFGIASLIYAFSGVLRSESGTGFDFLSKYLPGMGYIFAVSVWLSAMLAQEPKNATNIAGQPESEMLEELRARLITIKKSLNQD